jgi:uncharacterized protein (UPF0262 family)
MPDGTRRIARIELDEHMVLRRGAEIEHERAVAIADILAGNHFAPLGHRAGPYDLRLSIEESRLAIAISDADGAPVDRLLLPLLPFRRVVRDYFTVCATYFAAIRQAAPSRIEAIDMGRRALHDEGAEILRGRLADRVDVDLATARRLFTLICVLHLRPARGDEP